MRSAKPHGHKSHCPVSGYFTMWLGKGKDPDHAGEGVESLPLKAGNVTGPPAAPSADGAAAGGVEGVAPPAHWPGAALSPPSKVRLRGKARLPVLPPPSLVSLVGADAGGCDKVRRAKMWGCSSNGNPAQIVGKSVCGPVSAKAAGAFCKHGAEGERRGALSGEGCERCCCACCAPCGEEGLPSGTPKRSGMTRQLQPDCATKRSRELRRGGCFTGRTGRQEWPCLVRAARSLS
mmetsp:Transcript_96178/g.206373  ORF Transcript_96178/g.206373 Transcript_96178/m.206373 type:complete len:234 (-) Transcript_96178:249-950(-)